MLGTRLLRCQDAVAPQGFVNLFAVRLAGLKAQATKMAKIAWGAVLMSYCN